MSGPRPRDEIDPDLLERFRPQYEACLALDAWSEDNRPTTYPADDRVGMIVFWTYARSTKTYRASVRLCCRGYGVQAGMLNRSLWEDMLMAHALGKAPPG